MTFDFVFREVDRDDDTGDSMTVVVDARGTTLPVLNVLLEALYIVKVIFQAVYQS